MAITQKEIAARAGVSCATVSRVIREPQAVRPHLANRVLAAMRELGLEIKGTELVPERSIHILVVVNDLTYSLYGGFIAGISEATNERGLSLVLCNSQGDLEVEKNAVSTACRGGYIGIIFVTAEDTADYRELLRHISIPIVFLNRKIEGLDHDSVLLSHFETARIATRYLHDMGHRRIAMLSTDSESTNTRAEKAGFIDALLQSGVPYSVAEASIFHYPNTYQGGFQFARRFCGEEMDYTGLYAISSEQTAGFISNAMRRQNRQLKQLQILALNRSPSIVENDPRLLTMVQPVKEMGRKAVEVLLERMRQPQRDRMNVQYNALITAPLPDREW